MMEFSVLYPITTYVFFGLFCLAIGSFLNVLIYRLPLMLQAESLDYCQHLLNLTEKPAESINLFYPRSFCPNCKRMIPFWHNIPMLSYLLLRGRCSKCKQTIPLRYLVVETLCFALSLFAAYFFGCQLSLVFSLIFIWITLCLFTIDMQHQLLPDSLTYCLLWSGLIANTQGLFTTLPDAVLSAAAAYLFLWTTMQLFYLIRGKIGMGHGDFKLFAAFGAWFGWTQLPLILLFASFTGAITGLIYLSATKQSNATPIPFGPFLCLGGIISLFYGSNIIHTYLTWVCI